jgi:hypothetical protein
MIKKIKKLLGLCEHKWQEDDIKTYSIYTNCSRYVMSTRFCAEISCKKCYKEKTVKTEYIEWENFIIGDNFVNNILNNYERTRLTNMRKKLDAKLKQIQN